MTFKHPLWLLLALAVFALFLAAYREMARRRAVRAVRFSNLDFLIAAAQPPLWMARVLFGTWIAAGLLVALAAAGPRASLLVPVRDGTVMFCVDTSGSMATRDVAPTRASAARSAMQLFVTRAPSGVAIGIVSFSGDAQLVSPPTRDRERVLASLAAVPPPNGATAIGDALSLAAREMPSKGRRVIILITDGENNYGQDPVQAAHQLASARITLYTVGIGTNSGAIVPGTMQTAGIDEDALRQYAQITGGAYSRVEDADQLRRALAQLGRSTTFERRPVDLSLGSAIAGAALMALAFIGGIWTKSI